MEQTVRDQEPAKKEEGKHEKSEDANENEKEMGQDKDKDKEANRDDTADIAFSDMLEAPLLALDAPIPTFEVHITQIPSIEDISCLEFERIPRLTASRSTLAIQSIQTPQ
jgi:hypothetical protein